MSDSALIYIPDISGFTKFINETEIEHSQHIISELLEIIVDSNEINMSVSEIEGDAVLFFRKGDPPNLDELLHQTFNIYKNFHSHIKLIERDTICRCGACSTVTNLGLKFIVHFGNLRELKVSKFNKIMGSDVILAHRLLKNNITQQEYILLTNNYINSQDHNSNPKVQNFEKTHEKVENYGDLQIYFQDLSNLKKEIPILEKNRFLPNGKNSPEIKISVNAPLETVFRNLIDNKTKMFWIKGIKNVTQSTHINRINTSHTCEFDSISIDFVTKSSYEENKVLHYQEEAFLPSGQNFVSDYKLYFKNGNTIITLKIYYDLINSNFNWIQSLLQKIKVNIFIKILVRNQSKALNSFKKFCEYQN
jgi:hypothetical protein